VVVVTTEVGMAGGNDSRAVRKSSLLHVGVISDMRRKCRVHAWVVHACEIQAWKNQVFVIELKAAWSSFRRSHVACAFALSNFCLLFVPDEFTFIPSACWIVTDALASAMWLY
jgi:hypothetical protein